MLNLIIDRLKESTEVVAITTEARIFPLIRLQGSQVPALVLQLIGATPTDAKDRPSTLDTDLVEITGLASDPATTWALMEAAREALDGWSSGTIAEVRFRTHASDIFESSDLFTITATYAVRVHRDGTTLPTTLAGLGYDVTFRGGTSYTVTDLTATAGGTYELDGTATVYFVDYEAGAASGSFRVDLPAIADHAGRMIRIKTGANIDNSHDVLVRPAPGDTGATIDGAAGTTLDRDYDGITLLQHGSGWLVIQRKSK